MDGLTRDTFSRCEGAHFRHSQVLMADIIHLTIQIYT